MLVFSEVYTLLYSLLHFWSPSAVAASYISPRPPFQRPGPGLLATALFPGSFPQICKDIRVRHHITSAKLHAKNLHKSGRFTTTTIYGVALPGKHQDPFKQLMASQNKVQYQRDQSGWQWYSRGRQHGCSGINLGISRNSQRSENEYSCSAPYS